MYKLTKTRACLVERGFEVREGVLGEADDAPSIVLYNEHDLVAQVFFARDNDYARRLASEYASDFPKVSGNLMYRWAMKSDKSSKMLDHCIE